MKKLISTLAVCALALTGYSQTGDLPTSTWDTIREFLSRGSNWIVASYGTYATGGTKGVDPVVKIKPSYGGGIAGMYRINDFVLTGLRIDALDGGIYMPSFQAQLQLPLFNGRVTPFTLSGIATPISGKQKDNGEAIGIFGVGAAFRIGKQWGVVGDYEKWTSFEGNQVRAGLYWKF